MHRLHLTIESPKNSGARQVLVERFPFRLGRALENDLPLPYPSISGRHLVIDRDESGVISVTDRGSTNGTRLEDRILEANAPQPIELPARLRLGDIHLEIESATGSTPSFTMAQSSTRLHEMVDQAVRESSDHDARPFFEILSGPGGGRRFFLEPDDSQTTIGTDGGADIRLELAGVASEVADIVWEESCCWFDVKATCVQHEGAQLDGRHLLKSGDRFIIGAIELLYFDPLEDAMESLTPDRNHAAPTARSKVPTVEDEPAVEERDQSNQANKTDQLEPAVGAHTTPTADVAAPEVPEKTNSSRLGLVELALLAMSLFFFIATVALLWFFLS